MLNSRGKEALMMQDSVAETSGKNPKTLSVKKKKSEASHRFVNDILPIAFISLIGYILLAALIFFIAWYYITTPSKSTTLYSLQVIDSETDKTLFSYSASRANNSYGLYLSYEDLSEYCNFGVAGDEKQVTLYLTATDSIVCYKNSSLLSVNGNTVRISAPVLFEGDNYLFPVTLFENYLSGVEVTYDDAKHVCQISIPENPVFSLRMNRPEELEKCSPYDLMQFDDTSNASESSEASS